MSKRTKMILDLDTGIDDSMALAYALASEEIELLGITGIFGNVEVLQGKENTLRILQLLGHEEIPVFVGEDRPYGTKEAFHLPEVSKRIHGEDGIGNLFLPTVNISPQEMDAVDFIIQSCKEVEDLVIVPTGPLTNIAKAIEKAPEILKKNVRIILMGGALTVCGNVTPFAEANIYNDPVAADKVFRSSWPITMVGLDVTLRTLLTKKETAVWREFGTAAGVDFANMVDYYIGAYAEGSPYLGGCALHDPLAVAAAIHPTFIETLPLYMKVETEGVSAGRTIGDNARINDPNPNVNVAIGVDRALFLTDFTEKMNRILQMGKPC